MFNSTTVLNAFFGNTPLIGWRQNPNPEGIQMLDKLTSSSGLWFNKQHPLITIENLANVAPDFTIIDSKVSDWDNSTAYVVGQKSKYNGQIWKAIEDNTGSTPSGSSTDWKLSNGFTDWLIEQTQDGIIEVINYYLEKKVLNGSAKNLLKHDTLIRYSGNITDLKAMPAGFKGLEIIPARNIGVISKIHSVGIQLEQAQSVEIKLFKTGKSAPLKSESFNYTNATEMQWFTPTDVWELTGEGSYYLGYADAVTGQYINGLQDINAKGSSTRPLSCGDRYLEVTPFRTSQDGSALWDLSTNEYNLSDNYGLNLKLDVRCDYTEFIVDQKDLFKNAVAKGVGLYLLNELAWTPESRENRTNRNFKRSELLYERDSNKETKGVGFESKYEKAVKAITIDYRGINKDCLPCKKTGATIKNIG